MTILDLEERSLPQGDRPSAPLRPHSLSEKISHDAVSSLSTKRLKLPRYSSTLRDRLGGSKIERIFRVISVAVLEHGSKETTPDMKPSEGERQAIRRSGIRSKMWKTPCCSFPLGCHVYEKCESSILCTLRNGLMNFGRSSKRDHCS